MKKTVWTIIIIIVVIIAVLFGLHVFGKSDSGTTAETGAPMQDADMGAKIATAQYTCSNGETPTASFYAGGGTTTPVAGQPPVPTGSAMLTRADGSTVMLGQTVSADGGRYANADESLVFWDKGANALLIENGTQSTCTTTSSSQPSVE
jgi:membrane-bound inhibitor of C-type lysozyme